MTALANRLNTSLDRMLQKSLDLMHYDTKTQETANLQIQITEERINAWYLLKDLRRAVENTLRGLNLK